MRLRLDLVLLTCSAAFLGVANAYAACDGTAAPAGAQTLDIDGTRRTFVLRLPSPARGGKSAPVVFAFHPFGMNAQYMQSRAPIGRAWPEAVAVYPDAAGPTRAWQANTDAVANNDLRFFDAMLEWLDTHGCIDRTRIFVLGYSNGAQFAHRLACERAGAIAGIAAAAGRLPCTPERPVPVIMSHGLADRTAPYTPAVEAAGAWARRNSCAAPPAVGTPGCAEAASCADAAVTLCTYGGGHEYDPSFTARAVEFFRGVRAQ